MAAKHTVHESVHDTQGFPPEWVYESTRVARKQMSRRYRRLVQVTAWSSVKKWLGEDVQNNVMW